MHTILFICTGNTCRSPMAEAIAQRWIDGGGLGEASGAGGDQGGYLVASAGTMASESSPVSPEAVRALADMSVPTEGRSKPLTAEMVRRADVVFGMTAAHVEMARDLVEGDAQESAKILPLDLEGDVEDPFGMGQEVYDRLARRLADLIPKRLEEVLLHEDRAGVGSPRG